MATVAVIGRAGSRQVVDSSVAWLKAVGFRPDDVSVMVEEQDAGEEVRKKAGRRTSEGAAIGWAFGALVGGVFAWLVAIGVLVVPHVSPLLVTVDPRVATLAGVGAGGAVAWLVGALIGMCIPAHEVRRQKSSVRNGSVLLSVNADDVEWALRARRRLEEPVAERVVVTPDVMTEGRRAELH